ncbi:MAG TPA: toll/interleukin-1 receptor domain-containing protein, partial [Acetobacteraceae bacterium]|nr:toll/interleukin-1 receptor domain-containing protein [Acetobacteraceae bacterium]
MGLKVFLSYGYEPPENAALVDRIRAALDAAGFTTWIDVAAIKAGDDWRRTIMEGLRTSDWTLAFLSRHALRDPGVCLDELAIATHVKGGAIA